jgi:hypothetical protein
MNIAEAANLLNIQPDADHLVVKAAYHALAKIHHPDQGGDTAVMQRVNAAHDYMSTRTQQARLAEWERLQPKPAPQQPDRRQSWRVGQFDEFVNAREAARKASYSSPNSTPPPAGPTTRPWKPTPSRRERWTAWRRRQPWPVHWALNLGTFLLIMAGRLAVVATMFYTYAETMRWGIKALAHGAWVLLIIFPGIMVVLVGLMVTGILALNFLHGGWKGLADFLMDRGHEGLTPDPNACARKTTHTGDRSRTRTRWI